MRKGGGTITSIERRYFYWCRYITVTLILNNVLNFQSSSHLSSSHNNCFLIIFADRFFGTKGLLRPSLKVVLSSFDIPKVWDIRRARQVLCHGSSGSILKCLHLYCCLHLVWWLSEGVGSQRLLMKAHFLSWNQWWGPCARRSCVSWDMWMLY